jgi:hypothetical protein
MLGLRLAPGPEPAVAPAATTVAQSAAPALPVPARGAVGPSLGAKPAPAARRGPARAPAAAPPATPDEPWPGDELDARPLHYEPLAAPPLAAPPLALDAIALDPLEHTEPLNIEAAAGPADGAARPGEEETR